MRKPELTQFTILADYDCEQSSGLRAAIHAEAIGVGEVCRDKRPIVLSDFECRGIEEKKADAKLGSIACSDEHARARNCLEVRAQIYIIDAPHREEVDLSPV